VDNGFPWGSAGDLPTELALWLIGLGVEMIWNPARCPEKNGVVERSQGVGKNWAEPQRCRSADELQERIDRMDQVQREQYPRPGGGSRMQLFPRLSHSGWNYVAASETARWDWPHVAEHLAAYVAVRRVDSAGIVWVYNRQQYVGKRHQGQTVYVSFDPHRCEWIICDAKGTQLRTHPAPELAAENIRSLQITHRRPGKTEASQFQAKLEVA
jgi:hypothetical protein